MPPSSSSSPSSSGSPAKELGKRRLVRARRRGRRVEGREHFRRLAFVDNRPRRPGSRHRPQGRPVGGRPPVRAARVSRGRSPRRRIPPARASSRAPSAARPGDAASCAGRARAPPPARTGDPGFGYEPRPSTSSPPPRPSPLLTNRLLGAGFRRTVIYHFDPPPPFTDSRCTTRPRPRSGGPTDRSRPRRRDRSGRGTASRTATRCP